MRQITEPNVLNEIRIRFYMDSKTMNWEYLKSIGVKAITKSNGFGYPAITEMYIEDEDKFMIFLLKSGA